ncbi:MAG: ISNCY family transposase [Acidobacteriota bacterium]|nr:ISNCY family transposase [Acidobacteriota bacterium]
MTQKERDRLVALKKAKKKLITQKQVAAELGISERQVRRMLQSLKERGDKAVVHAARGRRSNRKIAAAVEQRAVAILSREVYQGFGPTLAAEYLAKKHKLQVGRETLRGWMRHAELWRAKPQRVEKVHQWRQRRSCLGQLVQWVAKQAPFRAWDTSEHAWLEGRGPKLYLISMIDDATIRLIARFVMHDSTAENMRLLWSYLESHGRPVSFYTDKATLFANLPKTKRGEIAGKDRPELPPAQIGRALKELDIEWIPAHSPQAKGRIERSFDTAQDRLVKGVARGRSQDAGSSQCVLGGGISTLVESDAYRGCRLGCGCASPVGQRALPGGQSQSCRYPEGWRRLHDPVRGQAVSDSAGRHSCRFTGWHSARRKPFGWHVGRALPERVSGRCRMSASPQSDCPKPAQPHARHTVGHKSKWMKNFHIGKNDTSRKQSIR